MDTKDAGRMGGKIGGKSRSKKKASAARKNGKKGGRPPIIHLDSWRTGRSYCGLSNVRCGDVSEVNCKRCVSAFTNQNQ